MRSFLKGDAGIVGCRLQVVSLARGALLDDQNGARRVVHQVVAGRTAGGVQQSLAMTLAGHDQVDVVVLGHADQRLTGVTV